MPGKGHDLLQKARQTKAGWKANELEALYLNFGFIIREGKGSHRVVSHPKFKHLHATFTAHAKELPKAYIAKAEKHIEEVIRLEKLEDNPSE
jgi:predicted RNA binding protein YcfA (HicA-like mRNA interferase family)